MQARSGQDLRWLQGVPGGRRAGRKLHFRVLQDARKKRPILMKIAQVAPLYESVPPHLYGGTERVVSYLTEALVEQGNDVTLFASGDSITEARLVAVCERSLRL